MPAYSGLRVAELRELCEERNIDPRGLNKPQLIEALRVSDENNDGSDRESEAASDAEGSEVEIGGGAYAAAEDGSDVVEAAASTAGDGIESETITVLRLKLALAAQERAARAEEWEREQQRGAMQPPARPSPRSHFDDVKGLLPSMCDSDALSFFMSYERVMQLNDIDDKSMWVKYLPARLTPKALKVFARLSADDSKDYDEVKRAILTSYKLDAHSYLKQFHSMRRTGNLTYKMHLTNLSETLRYYVDAKNISSFDDLFDAFLMEQFLTSLNPDVREFVLSKQPVNAKECAVYADLSFEVKRAVKAGNTQTNTGLQTQGGVHARNTATAGKGQSDQPKPANFSGKQFSKGRKPGACYICDEMGHRCEHCPKLALLKFKSEPCPTCGKNHPANSPCNGKKNGVFRAVTHQQADVPVDPHKPFFVSLTVNGTEVTGIRDTGNFGPVLVDRKLVSEEDIIPGKFVCCSGAFDGEDKRQIQLCRVKIKCPKFGRNAEIMTEAGVCDFMSGEEIKCNIGNAFFTQNPGLADIITVTDQTDTNGLQDNCSTPDAENVPENQSDETEVVTDTSSDTPVETLDGLFSVTTRSQAAAAAANCTDQDAPVVGGTDGVSDECDKDVTESATVDEDGLQATLRQLGDIDVTEINGSDECQPISAGAAEFREAQVNDPTLSAWWTRAKAGSGEYRIINGLLYKSTPPNVQSTNDYLLVVPQQYRTELIHMAHDTPFGGGHLGITKTRQRLSALYYFPKMNTLVSDYVRCCKQCQLTARQQKNERQPLQHVDIMQTHPFDDISIDILGGDLPVTARGNKFLLVITCNVSHWIHAIPLRNLKAETIADKLIELFCVFGLPRIVRSDNASGFKSELLTAVREKLGIEAKFSAPFHFQSHGLVERANQTLETMLRKFISENPKQWDMLVQYLLFALREVPHSGTKFSPAELVFGRKVRGLLDVARETWTGGGDPSDKQLKMSTTKYVEQLRGKIETALTAARLNTTEAEAKAKAHFDRNSSERTLDIGDLALILMPTTNHKLMATWKGPYKITRRLENGNYELAVGRRKAVRHINSLRKYHVAKADSSADSSAVMMIVTEHGDDSQSDLTTDFLELIERGDGAGPAPDWTMGEQLSADQQKQLRDLLMTYPDVFSGKPGRTDLTKHRIRVSDETPSYQAPYRIPEKLRDPVEKELNLMLQNGIIQHDSETTYNSPLIVIRKADGGVRLVNNFINLNKKTVDEQYPMTNASELLNRVAGAKYLTRIDLNRFFFQIPLDPSSRRYTGFQTPFGSFSYLRMPMGLRTASATAQRLIDRVLRGSHKYAASLLDDIVVFDSNWDSHLAHVKDILDRLRAAGLTANTKKCNFACSRIKILGHIVDDGRIQPDDEKIHVIQNWKVPKNKTQLRSFLGLSNFLRQYISHYAEIVFPLTELLARNKPDKLQWGAEEQRAFDELKAALISKPVLRSPDLSKGFKLYCDSSRTALSAILMQSDDDGGDYVIGYASRKLLPREQKYPIVELELMAIVYGLTKFNHWTYSAKVDVFTDHRPLQWLASLSNHSSRLARWSLMLQNHDITTTYISGDKQIADALTRMD